MSFDPLSPSQASTSRHPDHSTFHTLTRERAFRHPPSSAPDVPALEVLVRPHIDSFNALIEDEGGKKGLLQLGVEDLGEKAVWDAERTTRVAFQIETVNVSRPLVPDKDKLAVERKIFPSEARERLCSYKSKLTVKLKWTVSTEGGEVAHEEVRECGLLPVMVRVS